MVRSLFLFDMTFLLYLASLTLHIAYLGAHRPVMALASGGHSTESGMGEPESFIIDQRESSARLSSGRVTGARPKRSSLCRC
jgi:hypothetical protein